MLRRPRLKYTGRSRFSWIGAITALSCMETLAAQLPLPCVRRVGPRWENQLPSKGFAFCLQSATNLPHSLSHECKSSTGRKLTRPQPRLASTYPRRDRAFCLRQTTATRPTRSRADQLSTTPLLDHACRAATLAWVRGAFATLFCCQFLEPGDNLFYSLEFDVAASAAISLPQLLSDRTKSFE